MAPADVVAGGYAVAMAATEKDRRPAATDRQAVEDSLRELISGVSGRRKSGGASAFIDGPPGIGKSFLIRDILKTADDDAGGGLTVLRAAADHRRRNEPFATIEQLTGPAPDGSDPSDGAFDRVDMLCGTGTVLAWVDDAQHCDAASLAVLRRLVWASRDLPLVVLITARPLPVREQLEMVARQADLRCRLPPMDRMMVERLVFDRTRRWPAAGLRSLLEPAAGNPLFVTELLRSLDNSDALLAIGADTVDVRPDAIARPAGLEATIREHLGQLDESASGVVAVLAVWGTAVRVDDLATTLYTSADDLRAPLRRAIESGLVRRVDPVDPSTEDAATVDFSHDLYREVRYADLPEADRRATHRRIAQVLRDTGGRPGLVAEHALRGAASDAPSDPQVVAALQEAVRRTRLTSPEVAADLLGDADAIAALPPPAEEKLLVQRSLDLFLAGRGRAAEQLIRERIGTVTDRAVAGGLQSVLIRSLVNRADVDGSLAAIDRTAAIPGLPPPVLAQMDALRSWVRLLDGELPTVAEGEALLSRFVAAADTDAQAAQLNTLACAAYLSGDDPRARELFDRRSSLVTEEQDMHARSTALVWPAMIALSEYGPAAGRAAVDRARRLSAARAAQWLDPFLGFVAGGAAFDAGDWDDAAAELDTALEQAEEAGTGWISIPVGNRAYLDAHRGDTAAARARLDDFRGRGLPLQFGRDDPGRADLAILEAEGATRAASTLARALWAAARTGPSGWCLDLAPDVSRVAVVGMERRLAEQVAGDLASMPFAAPEVVGLVHGMIVSDADEIELAATRFAADGRRFLAACGWEELACAAAAGKDRVRAASALDAAVVAYEQLRAVPDRDRVLARARALGVRRGAREGHRTVDSGWASLTATERRIAALVRDGLTNREIGTRLFVSPRTVQTHVSHVLAKTGLRSRVEVAAAAVDLG
jgi:DNA-binding CsgD family transcriptional regulator